MTKPIVKPLSAGHGRHSDAGKGDKRVPAQISAAEEARRWRKLYVKCGVCGNPRVLRGSPTCWKCGGRIRRERKGT